MRVNPTLDTLVNVVTDCVAKRWFLHTEDNLDKLLLYLSYDLHGPIKTPDIRKELQIIRTEVHDAGSPNQHDRQGRMLQLIRSLADALDATESTRSPEENHNYAVITVTTLLAMSTHEDKKWQQLEHILDRGSRELKDGHNIDDCLPLRLMRIYISFGRASDKELNPMSSTNMTTRLPEITELQELLERVEQATTVDQTDNDAYRSPLTEADKVFAWAFALLSSSIELLPFAVLGDEAQAWTEWVESKLGSVHDNRRAFEHDLTLAKVRYALDDLDGAVSAASRAVQQAPALDERFIAEARQFHNFFMLEQHSRQSNKDEAETLVAKATAEIERAAEDERDKVTNLHQELRVTQEHGEERLQAERAGMSAELRNEVRGALLRVVEVLGVFMAVVGIVVTAAGGIGSAVAGESLGTAAGEGLGTAAGGSLGTAVAIYGLGFSTIVVLFVILRWIVNGHPFRRLQDVEAPEKARRDTPTRREG